MSDTREVEIAYAYDPATDGPDLARIGQRLTLPKVEARKLVQSGQARYVDVAVDEVGRPLADQADSEVNRVAEAVGVKPEAGESRQDLLDRIRTAQAEQQVEAKAEDLLHLTKDELREQFPAAAALPGSATKTELVEAVVYPESDDGIDGEVGPDGDPADPDGE